MLPLVDKPVVQYVVEELVRAGIARVLFVTGRRKRAIEDHFDADPELDTGPLIAKPDPAAVPSRLAIIGRYVLGPRVFASLRETPPDEGGEVQLSDALQRVIDSGGRVAAVPLAEGERRHDIGSVESYCATFI